MTDEMKMGLKREIYALMSLYDQPFFIKSELVGLNVEFFSRLFDNVVFVVLRRNPIFIAQSIYRARMLLHANPKVYWSTRPSNEAHLTDVSPAEQIALQIRGIYDDIYAGLHATNERFVEVKYESLCENPRELIGRLTRMIGEGPEGLDLIPNKLKNMNRDELPPNLIEELARALSKHLE